MYYGAHKLVRRMPYFIGLAGILYGSFLTLKQALVLSIIVLVLTRLFTDAYLLLTGEEQPQYLPASVFCACLIVASLVNNVVLAHVK